MKRRRFVKSVMAAFASVQLLGATSTITVPKPPEPKLAVNYVMMLAG